MRGARGAGEGDSPPHATTRTVRMPSVVISDCSDDMFQDPCWNWRLPGAVADCFTTAALNNNNAALTTTTTADQTESHLSVRRFSDCSSSSSLGTLDMDLTASETISSFRCVRQQYEFDTETDPSIDVVFSTPSIPDHDYRDIVATAAATTVTTTVAAPVILNSNDATTAEKVS